MRATAPRRAGWPTGRGCAARASTSKPAARAAPSGIGPISAGCRTRGTSAPRPARTAPKSRGRWSSPPGWRWTRGWRRRWRRAGICRTTAASASMDRRSRTPTCRCSRTTPGPSGAASWSRRRSPGSCAAPTCCCSPAIAGGRATPGSSSRPSSAARRSWPPDGAASPNSSGTRRTGCSSNPGRRRRWSGRSCGCGATPACIGGCAQAPRGGANASAAGAGTARWRRTCAA